MIVELIESGQKVSVVSKEYGLKVSMIKRWRREFTDPKKPNFTGKGNPSLTVEQQENAQLKKELKNALLERDILKKAVAIFSNSDKTSINV